MCVHVCVAILAVGAAHVARSRRNGRISDAIVGCSMRRASDNRATHPLSKRHASHEYAGEGVGRGGRGSNCTWFNSYQSLGPIRTYRHLFRKNVLIVCRLCVCGSRICSERTSIGDSASVCVIYDDHRVVNTTDLFHCAAFVGGLIGKVAVDETILMWCARVFLA